MSRRTSQCLPNDPQRCPKLAVPECNYFCYLDLQGYPECETWQEDCRAMNHLPA
jgi:hypothetical protein